MKRITTEGMWLALTNLLLATFFGFFAYAHALSFLKFFRPSGILMVAKESLDAGFFLIRRAPLKTSTSFYHWGVALGGTLLPLCYRPAQISHDFTVGQYLQFLGLALQIASVISLNRSFGIVAANRGVKTGGLYHFVRHPLYSSYILGNLGYLMSNLNTRNALVFTCATLFQVLRIFVEEDFLKRDSAYSDYIKRTPWKLIPWIF